MAASESLGRQFYHSTDSELQPGDVITPGHRRPRGHHASDDFPEYGHTNFTWMTTEKPGTQYGRPGQAIGGYGRNHYEVEPLGLHHPYSFHLAKTGYKRTMNERAFPEHQPNWVSLGGARVIRKLGDDEPRVGDTRD